MFEPNPLAADPAGFWLGLPVWIILGWTAIIDARTGRVPDLLLLPGAVIALAGLIVGTLHSIPDNTTAAILFILQRLFASLAFGSVVWALNELWYRWRGHDALGMGDAKWSMLAILAFGLIPVLWAWPLAAGLGLLWLALRRWQNRPTQRLFFAPFLCIGLVVGQVLLFYLKR